MSGRRLLARAARQDPGDPSYAVLERHRKRAMARLSAETEVLVGEGVRVEEIVWVLTPDSASAMLAADLIDGFESRGAHELARTIATVRAELESGHCVCAYLGPEGHFFEWIRIDPIEGATATPPDAGIEGDHDHLRSAAAAIFDALAEPVRAALCVLLLEHRFAPPLHAAAVGAEGRMLYLRFVANGETGGLDAQQLTEHAEGGALGTPINVLLTDARGQVARVVIRDGRAPEVTVLP